ncbi:MAG: hypothetical protein V1792_23585 [Pseudomonadota bacterium]
MTVDEGLNNWLCRSAGTVAEMKKRFEAYPAGLTKGNVPGKVRIVLEWEPRMDTNLHQWDFEKLVGVIRQMHQEMVTHAGRAVNLSVTVRNWLMGFYIAERNYALKIPLTECPFRSIMDMWRTPIIKSLATYNSEIGCTSGCILIAGVVIG